MTVAAEAALSRTDARALTDQIKVGVEAVWQLITRAYTERAWDVLGYSSWDDYCTREFGTSRLRLPREERTEVVSSLRDSGLSLRAIEAATGVSRPTIIKDLAAHNEVVNSLPPASGETPAEAEISGPRHHEVGDDGALYCIATAECIHCGKTLPLTKLYEGGQGYECDPCVSPDPEGVPEPILPPDHHENVVELAPKKAPRPITGTDGKTYNPKPAAAPKAPRRKPITEAFDSANYELRRSVERVIRLTEDDRFTKNKDQISGANLSDLIRARDAINGVIQQLEG